MGKKNLDEINKQDRRLKAQEAAVFKVSKNNPTVSTDLVIAQAAPESKNMELVHVKRSNKLKKSRPKTQVTSKPSKEHQLFEYNSSLSGDGKQPTGAEVISSNEHKSIEFDCSLSGEALEHTEQAFSGDEIPVNGEENIEKENSDLENSLMRENGNISKAAVSIDDPISIRKVRKNRSPIQKKFSVQTKASSSSKLEVALLGPAAQDGKVNITIRKKSSKGNSDNMESPKEKENKSLNGNAANYGKLRSTDSPSIVRNETGNSPNEERKHSKQKKSQTEGNMDFSFPVKSQQFARDAEGKKRNQWNETGNMPNFSLMDHSPDRRSEEIAPEILRPEANADGNKRTWKSMFSGNRNALADYKLTKELSVVPADVIELTEQDADDLAEHWGYGLLAYVAGRSTGKQAIDNCCKKWGVPYVLHFHESGWIIIKFSTEEDRDKVLLQGPYYIFGKLLMLKELPRFFDFSNYEINLIPIWVHILKLPLDFWNVRSLSKLGGFLGKPIQTDKITYTRGRVSFVRILVEMDLSKSLPEAIPVKLPNGRLIEAKVEYEFIPKICAECKGIGHGEDRCFLLHPELKPKNQTSNTRAKQQSENTVEATKNHEDRNATYPKMNMENPEAVRVATNSFRNSFSQSFGLNQAATSWKKVTDSSERTILDTPAKQVSGEWRNRNHSQSLMSANPDKGKEVIITAVVPKENQKYQRRSVNASSSDHQNERNQQTPSNSDHVIYPNYAQEQQDADMRNNTDSTQHSGSDTEEGEFQIPNKRHSTRNTNWTKAVIVPDNSIGRGPTPSSPQ